MKKLNGKCLDAFGDKCAYDYKEFMELPESCQNALIVEFFDLVGIYIAVEPQKEFKNVYFDVSVDFELHSVWGTRLQAIENAIIKANELYNQNNSYLAHS